MILFKDFEDKTSHLKIHRLINNPAVVDELAVLFRTADKHLEDERKHQKRGISATLLAIVMRNLLDSEQLWKKMARIIGTPAHVDTLNELNKVFKNQCVMQRIATIIKEYLSSLCELNDDFFVDLDSIADEKKRKLFKSIEVSHMILIIHHLLNHHETAKFFAKKIFNTYELSPSFIRFLKLSLRNLSLWCFREAVFAAEVKKLVADKLKPQEQLTLEQKRSRSCVWLFLAMYFFIHFHVGCFFYKILLNRIILTANSVHLSSLKKPFYTSTWAQAFE